MLNTNADTIASEVAKALADRFEVILTFCFEKKGVLSNPEDENSVIKEIVPSTYRDLKSEGVISGGMIPKLDNAFRALEAGVSKVVITEAGELGKGTGTVVHL
jgi:acetylglutamate kinase